MGASFDDVHLSGNRSSKLVVMDDGQGPKLYLGGFFDSVGGVPASRLARWDGNQWEAVGGLSIPDGYGIAALAALRLSDRPAESLFVGGEYYKLGNVFSRHIGEWVGCPTGLAAGE